MLRLDEQIYRFFLEQRRRKFAGVEPVRVPGCAVISVGNITTGGTGKTPTVQFLARGLQDRGARVAVVARGYGGSLSKQGAVVSDGDNILLDAAQVGDEPLLHARWLPGIVVVIGRDRVQAVRHACELGCNVVLLDDAFQYWSLKRDFDLVLMDACQPFGNGHLLPRGRLREPPTALSRASAIVLTRSDAANETQIENSRRLISRYTGAPIYAASHQPLAVRNETDSQEHDLSVLRGLRVAAVSALADNEGFHKALRALGAEVVASCARRDHHAWRASELSQLTRRAQACGAQAIVTSAKDAVKLRASWFGSMPLWSLLIRLRFVSGEADLWRDIQAVTRNYLAPEEQA